MRLTLSPLRALDPAHPPLRKRSLRHNKDFVLSAQAKLVAGEECLSTALPCDVAGLVKQFFRELPEPVLPSELQEAFLKAQQLPGEEDKTSATVLLSCVLPDRNLTTLRYFFDFLQNVSSR